MKRKRLTVNNVDRVIKFSTILYNQAYLWSSTNPHASLAVGRCPDSEAAPSAAPFLFTLTALTAIP